MKTKSKIFVLLLTVALLCGMMLFAASAEETTEYTSGFTVTGADGTVTYHAGTGDAAADYAALQAYIDAMTETGKITLYQDYEVPQNGELYFPASNTEFDLNGHTLKTAYKSGNGFIGPKYNAGNSTYIYSSKPGAQILADAPKAQGGGGFIFYGQDYGGPLYVGRAKDGTTYPGNLTVKGACLAQVGRMQVVFDGITYVNTVTDNSGAIQFGRMNATVTINNCDFTLAMTMVAANKYSGTGGWRVTIQNSRIRATKQILSVSGGAESYEVPGMTITDSVLCTAAALTEDNVCANFPLVLGTGVRMNYANEGFVKSGLVPAHIDSTSVTLNEKSFDLLYEVTEDSNVASVIFKVGTTELATEKWMVGNTPKYSGALFGIGDDPDNADNVLVPTGKWLIDGMEVTALTSEQAGKTLVAEAGFESKPKAFAVTDAEGTTYYTDIGYDPLYDFITGMSAAAKITLYQDYVIPAGKALTFSVADTEIDLNGHTVTATDRFGGGFLVAKAQVYIYSSAPNAKISTESKGFIFDVPRNGALTLGRAKDGSTYKASNLTMEGTCLAQVNNTTLTLDSITYVNTVTDNNGAIQFDGGTVNVNIKNCDMSLAEALFGAYPNVVNLTVSVSGSRMYIASSGFFNPNPAKGFDKEKSTLAVSVSDSILCTDKNFSDTYADYITFDAGVCLNLPDSSFVKDGLTLAHVTPADIKLDFHPGKGSDGSSGHNVFTLLYEVVAPENTFTATFTGGGEQLAQETWKTDSIPTFRTEAFDTYYWSVTATEGIGADTTYIAKLKSTESKITGNLTLFANITFNLYFRKDGYIKGVSYNGGKLAKTFTDEDIVLIGEEEYYLFKLATIAPKDLSAAFDLDVTLENGENTATYSVKTSLVKYAASVLKSEESTEGKTLVLALLDYVRETSVSLGQVQEDFAGIRAIDACLAKYEYKRIEWTKPEEVTVPAAGDITGAALELVNTPGFVFFLNDTYAEKDTVTVTVNGVAKEYKVTHGVVENAEKHYFTVDSIHVSNYRNDLTVTLGEQTFTYNFDVYMAGFTAVPAYAHALYAYSVAAEAYLASQNGN